MSRLIADIPDTATVPLVEERTAPPAVLSPASERLLGTLFSLYRRTLSPVFAASHLGHCRYLPTCSEYAYLAVIRHGWLRGSALALRRLGSCHPWSAGGLDPVPPPKSASPPPSSVSPVAGPEASRHG